MKIKILLLTLGLLMASCGQKQSTISGEMLVYDKAGKRQKLVPGTIFVFKREKAEKFKLNDASILKSKVDEVYMTTETDSNGQFELKVPKGEYNVVAQHRFDTTYGNTAVNFWNIEVSVQEEPARVKLTFLNATGMMIEKPTWNKN